MFVIVIPSMLKFDAKIPFAELRLPNWSLLLLVGSITKMCGILQQVSGLAMDISALVIIAQISVKSATCLIRVQGCIYFNWISPIQTGVPTFYLCICLCIIW